MDNMDFFRVVVGTGLLFLLAYWICKDLFARGKYFFGQALSKSQHVKRLKKVWREKGSVPGLRPGTEEEYIFVLWKEGTTALLSGIFTVLAFGVALLVIWLILPI